jgi:Flp pilus assembly protein TadD
MSRGSCDRQADLAPRRGCGHLCVLMPILLLSLSGCAGRVVEQAPMVSYDPALLTGERLFDEPLESDGVPTFAISASDADMRAYVAEHTGGAKLAVSRLRLLIEALLDDGYFGKVSYNPHETLTAAEAFRSRSGNCLSFTNLFVAMAREAGLDAVYQIVEVPPSWDADSGFLIRYTHVNVLLRGLRLDHQRNEVVTVDFNIVQPDPEHVRRAISDDYAASLFYANLSVDRLRGNQPREAFAYLRRAIELAPHNADLWVNLGALYGSRGDFGGAVGAYEVALQVQPRNRAALSGLARGHAMLGNDDLAARYESQARDYLETNPYYHLAIAQSAYLRGDLDLALSSINRALSLERRSGRLHFVKGLIEERRGEADAARESFRHAKRYGVASPQKRDRIERAIGMHG